MGTSDFDKLWQQIQALSDAERQTLQELLSLAPAEDTSNEDALERRLVAVGVLALPARSSAMRSWQPIVLTGPPLSDTLLQDRR
jgi:hypothetical protein